MSQVSHTNTTPGMISVVIPVYRNAANALDLVESLLQQDLPPGTSLEIIVVDDGSGDGSAELLGRREDRQVRFVALPRNMGRSVARNMGADHASGEHLVFIDCDCRPTDRRFLSSHLRLLRGTCIASCGPVTGDGDGFWSRYQGEASDRRARQHADGIAYAGSTQNFTVRADAYRQSSGFDPRYSRYGFEDRDLFVRLSRMGTLGWCSEARVRHLDKLTLPDVMGKMHLAAGGTAIHFAHDHPAAYQALGYAALDTRLHTWLRPIAKLSGPALRMAPLIDRLLANTWVPYRVAKLAVKLLVALAYMHGTTVPSKSEDGSRAT